MKEQKTEPILLLQAPLSLCEAGQGIAVLWIDGHADHQFPATGRSAHPGLDSGQERSGWRY
jgi:hypothetical protein